MNKDKNRRGRPKAITPKKLALLEHAFDIGATDEEACISAQISTSTLYNYQLDNPYFLEEKETRKLKPVLLARETIHKALLAGDVAIAKWYLERKKKDEFATYLIEDNSPKDRYTKMVEEDPRALDTAFKAYEAAAKTMGYRVEYVKITD